MSAGIVIGGGLAAQRAVETLRRSGYEGRVRMICAEPRPPYDRPPLSKAVLADATYETALAYRSPGWYEEQAIELLLGRRAAGLDGRRRQVRLDDGAGSTTSSC